MFEIPFIYSVLSGASGTQVAGTSAPVNESLPKVYFGSNLYDVGQIVDKTLIAKSKLPVYTGKPAAYGLKPVAYIESGNPAGQVYSWVIDSDGSVLWMFDAKYSNIPSNTYGSYFIKHDKNAFDISALKQQGVLNLIEQAAANEEDNTPWYEKLGKNVKGLAITALLIWGSVEVIKTVSKK